MWIVRLYWYRLVRIYNKWVGNYWEYIRKIHLLLGQVFIVHRIKETSRVMWCKKMKVKSKLALLFVVAKDLINSIPWSKGNVTSIIYPKKIGYKRSYIGNLKFIKNRS